jgi:hypothetical protein
LARFAASVAGDAYPDRGLKDALQLERAIGTLSVIVKHLGGFCVSSLKGVSHLPFSREVPNDDEIPRLHEVNGRRMICTAENTP